MTSSSEAYGVLGTAEISLAQYLCKPHCTTRKRWVTVGAGAVVAGQSAIEVCMSVRFEPTARVPSAEQGSAIAVERNTNKGTDSADLSISVASGEWEATVQHGTLSNGIARKSPALITLAPSPARAPGTRFHGFIYMLIRGASS